MRNTKSTLFIKTESEVKKNHTSSKNMIMLVAFIADWLRLCYWLHFFVEKAMEGFGFEFPVLCGNTWFYVAALRATSEPQGHRGLPWAAPGVSSRLPRRTVWCTQFDVPHLHAPHSVGDERM